MLQLTNNITLNAVFQRLGNHAYILHLKLGGCLDQQKSIMGLEVLSRELSKKRQHPSHSKAIKKHSHLQKFKYYTPHDVNAGLDNIKIHKTASPEEKLERGKWSNLTTHETHNTSSNWTHLKRRNRGPGPEYGLMW